MHVRFRRRVSLGLAAICVVALTGCARFDDNPRPTPAQTLSSERSDEGQKPPERAVCDLMTADERQALAGQSMNDVIPTNAVAGTLECQWVHSLAGSSTAIIRLVAFNTAEWAKVAPLQLQQAMRNPRLSAAMVEQLQKAARKLARGTSKLSTDEICDVYWVLARASGFRKNTQVVFSSMIGRMRAAYNAGCGDGVLTMIGYGEYGLTTSIALYQSIIELRKVVQQRAAEEFGDLADGAEPDSSAEPSPEPSESASATTGSADETE